MSSLPPRRGAYGFDAPYAPLLMALGGACLLALAAWRLGSGDMNSTPRAIATFAPGVAGLWLFLNAGFFVYTTRAGKFADWAELLDRLELKGDERLLDVGCGRGAVLLMAAQRLPRGRAVGVDIWSTKDQSGKAEQVTRRNAELEGVADRVELHTADMRQLPFADGSFDVVVSSLAIHNISGAGERARALREVARVMEGRRVKEGIRAMIVPGSGLVRAQAEEEGIAQKLIEAGFDWRMAGCSMCLGMNPDQLAPGERCASTSNRNFEGRQGRGGRTHLLSPAMAAAAAITGHLTDVRELM